MNEHVSNTLFAFAEKLRKLAVLLNKPANTDEMLSKFVDLAPTDEADKAGVYSEALHYATNNPKVLNIALTGPYGSGKSSIIQSYLKGHQTRALHISLAAFLPDAETGGGNVSRQEIERSILQQMLYGADANKLPLSRFKRIQSPGMWARLKSLWIMLGLLALWSIFVQSKSIVEGSFFTPFAPSNWFNYMSLALAALFLWIMLHRFYVASFGISLKSISLKNIEMQPASDDRDSILNRHLDEIIYFFQSTQYELVIIEDLDRFENSEVFVTLREINSLVNQNAGVKRTVRFLYALRDDVFVNTDRTKFFEFIIPVIPIINASNSIDKMIEQGKRLDLDQRLDRQFLREVSRYLNDLRLIQNIFNEYAIYSANLETDDENTLDANKLLAILIYKNVYPKDFERLHRGEGNLAGLLKSKDEFIAHGEAAKRSEIAELERLLEAAERQTPANLKQLRQIYAMALIEKLPVNTISVGLQSGLMVPLPSLVEDEALEEIIVAPQLTYRVINQTLRFENSDRLNDASPPSSYQRRKAEVEHKAEDFRHDTLRRIQAIRSEITKLRTNKFNELLRSNAGRSDELFEIFGDRGDLARFLTLEGHLDDSYYQYTSLFHSGRLSPDDNKFLIKIRAFSTPEPDFPIDNPKEVVAGMRDDDFGQSYVLNNKLVDCLLGSPQHYADHLARFFEFISSSFERCEDFLEAYYASGQHVPQLLSELIAAWKEFIPAAIASRRNVSHITQLLANSSARQLAALASEYGELSKLASQNLPAILAQAPELEPTRLESLGIEVSDFALISDHPVTLRYMFDEGLFDLSIANLDYAYREILCNDDAEALSTRNFTALRTAGSDVLLRRVERNFDRYFVDVLMELEGNTDEDPEAILALLSRDDLDQDDLLAFVGRQIAYVPTLEDLPTRWYARLFKVARIEPTWANCLAFINSDVFEAEQLIDYLGRNDIRAELVERPMPDDADALPLRQFLLNASSLSDTAYREYIEALPNPFKNFPDEVGQTKLRILIDERKITLTKESLDALADDQALQVAFVASNIIHYLAEPDQFALDDDFREQLLRSNITDSDRRSVIAFMNLDVLPELPLRAALIGPVLDRTKADMSSLSAEVARALIEHSEPVETQISLLYKSHGSLSVDLVRQILAGLPKPYSEIQTGYSSPRLKGSAENLALVEWLDSRKIISSWSRGIFTDDIRVNLYRR